MFFNRDLELRFYFADATLAVQKSAIPAFNQEPWTTLRTNNISAQRFFYADQTHGTDGLVITKHMVCDQRNLIQADYLITNVPGVALANFTADCLPIILYDWFNNAIALIHAGWRGSVAGVATKALAHMKQLFGTDPECTLVVFGPSAQVCCYQVNTDFIQNIKERASGQVLAKVLCSTKNGWHFDLPLFNALLLQNAGVTHANISFAGIECCTICNRQYCSYRRDATDQRNINLAFLK